MLDAYIFAVEGLWLAARGFEVLGLVRVLGLGFQVQGCGFGSESIQFQATGPPF